MAHKTPVLLPVGKTEDGKTIVQGLFEFVDTHGVPMDLVLWQFQENNMMPDWVDFWEKAMKSGWGVASTLTKLEMAVGDVYGPVFRDAWKPRMQKMIANMRV